MITYKLLKEIRHDEVCAALRSDGVSFPFNPANTDYQAYLRWLDEGNEPLPPDEVSDA